MHFENDEFCADRREDLLGQEAVPPESVGDTAFFDSIN